MLRFTDHEPGQLRGRPAPNRYELYFVLIDGLGAVATYPFDSPDERIGFDILAP